MIDEWRIGKDVEGSSRGLIKNNFRLLPGGAEKTKKNLSQDDRSSVIIWTQGLLNTKQEH
jgi:hypothetical protein